MMDRSREHFKWKKKRLISQLNIVGSRILFSDGKVVYFITSYS